ncbi:hypothetical protein H072_3201 [Dactylellina haptotyla CBS 200.50]|uniref:Dihydrolipoamide acetyltransferase component of pyruvate dehydrogenase complex n=1 Tax=Dactylellina haptotyla (strain CBS 200.50) TaxID=1284197 RepID=S8BTG7_DACHA|nr:hypothetical protein H072_3201 [Dactylellina haptotyla CBS 200.50]
MASPSMCGPSNPLQNLKNHTSLDRSLQQDRFRSSSQASSQFRHQPNLTAQPLDHEFEQFLSTSPGLSQQQRQLRSRPSLQNFAPSAPSPALQQQSWASDFQRLQINTPPPLQQQAPVLSGGWGAEFLSHMNGPIAAAPTTSVIPQNNHLGSGYISMNGGSAYMGPGVMNSYPTALHSTPEGATQISVVKPVENYTDAEFDQMFEEAAAQQIVGHQELGSFPQREVPQPLQTPLSQAVEPVSEQETKAEEKDNSQEDADELARTAGQLVDTLSQDTSKKFQESQFVALMRKLRDKTVRVEDGKMVEGKLRRNPLSSRNDKNKVMWRRSLLSQARSSRRVAWQAGLQRAHLHYSRPVLVVKPFLLADIGEGIRECEIIQWFVQPGAQVQQFDNICEVQSDKASVEISSRYDGVIKKLYYEAGDMAIVGKPLVDIDMADVPEDAPQLVDATVASGSKAESPAQTRDPLAQTNPTPETKAISFANPSKNSSSGKHRTLATPAVRRLIKERDIDITKITGTGKDGRVLKEDVERYVHEPEASVSTSPVSTGRPRITSTEALEEQTVPLTPVQSQMFKMMTKSLAIPHFLYADEASMDRLVTLRNTINKNLAHSSDQPVKKISYMPFFIKAVSVALEDFPLINSRVDLAEEAKPKLVMRPSHNIGVAMDTPSGLLVPNIKNVQNLSVLEIAAELNRLQAAGSMGKLSATDLKGGTITLSNIGNVGGTYVAPVVVTSEVAIMGIGRTKVIPAFDENGAVVPKSVVNFSWSADHRVIDGGTMARMASLVKRYCEEPELLISKLR